VTIGPTSGDDDTDEAEDENATGTDNDDCGGGVIDGVLISVPTIIPEPLIDDAIRAVVDGTIISLDDDGDIPHDTPDDDDNADVDDEWLCDDCRTLLLTDAVDDTVVDVIVIDDVPINVVAIDDGLIDDVIDTNGIGLGRPITPLPPT
jgi:hypothetical protein